LHARHSFAQSARLPHLPLAQASCKRLTLVSGPVIGSFDVIQWIANQHAE